MRANRITACFVAAFLACGGGACALAAPAIPVSIDWFAAGTAPGLDVYRSGPITMDVTIKTNGTPYNFTGSTPVGWWATSNTASAVVTGTVTVLSATAGTFRVAFSGSDMNYTAGRYIYGIGLTSGSYTTARQGTMLIRADPYAAGASPVTWTSNVNWGAYQFLQGGSGPAIGDGSTITWTTNAGGQVVMTASVASVPVTNLGAVVTAQSSGGYSTVQTDNASSSLIVQSSDGETYVQVAGNSFPGGNGLAVVNGKSEVQLSLNQVPQLRFQSDRVADFAGGVITNVAAIYPGRVYVPMGECSYFSLTGTNVAIGAATTDGITNMVQVTCASEIAANSMGFDNGGADDGTLRYTGSVTRGFHIAVTVSFAGAGAGDTLVFAIAKNGAIAGASRILNRVQNVNDKQSTAIQVYLELATNDELTVWAGNLSDADDVTVHSVNFFAMGM